MSIYYLETSVGNFRLNSTSKITKTISGKATDNPVEAGFSISDHYVNSPDIFDLEGVLTDVGGGSQFSQNVIVNLTAIKEAGEPVILHYGGSITPSDGCVIERFSLTQDSTNGYSGGSSNNDSFKVSLSLKKIRTVTALVIVAERSLDISDKTSDKSTSSATTQLSDIDKEDYRGLAGYYNNAARSGVINGS